MVKTLYVNPGMNLCIDDRLLSAGPENNKIMKIDHFIEIAKTLIMISEAGSYRKIKVLVNNKLVGTLHDHDRIFRYDGIDVFMRYRGVPISSDYTVYNINGQPLLELKTIMSYKEV